MRTVLVILLFFLSPTIHSIAQTNDSIAGTIKDKQGNALYGANVVAYSEDENILAYTTTDKSGNFKLNHLPPGADHITISYLGYRPIIVKSAEFAQLRSITLEEQTFNLKEVTVKADRIAESGDTLTYSVASFKQAQDRSIADVISKMPGLEVKPNGTIEYQGKAISKFYIEGLNLMGSQYSLASNNIHASKVKSIQVLENHQDIKSIKHMNFNEQAALNIVLKDEAKSVWTGTADLGVGYAPKSPNTTYDNRLLGMQFNKKFQSLMLYKNNNIGTDIGNEVKDIADLAGYKAESGLIKMMELGGPAFDKHRYTFNASHILAGNWLWKTGENANLRMQFSGYHDKEKQQSMHSTTYLTVDGMPIVTENSTVTGRKKELKGEVCYTLNADRTYLRSSTKGYIDRNSSFGEIICNDKQLRLLVKRKH